MEAVIMNKRVSGMKFVIQVPHASADYSDTAKLIEAERITSRYKRSNKTDIIEINKEQSNLY